MPKPITLDGKTIATVDELHAALIHKIQVRNRDMQHHYMNSCIDEQMNEMLRAAGISIPITE